MEVRAYDTLPDDARLIREEVFMREQGYQDEFDEVDDAATHLVAYEGDVAVGTCRIFDGGMAGECVLGRLAVRKPWRSAGVGSFLVREAMAHAAERGRTLFSLHAQCRVRGFYESMGFVADSATDLDEGVPHVWMHKSLD